MARRRKKPKTGEPFRLNLELPGELVAEIDGLADGQLTRVATIRGLLHDALTDLRLKLPTR